MDQKIAELEARGDRSATMRVEEYRTRYGLDKPILTQYWLWISNFVQGDFGISFEFERPVRELIGQRLTLSIILSLTTLTFTWAIAIPLGVYSAVNQYSFGDQVITTMAFVAVRHSRLFVSSPHLIYCRGGTKTRCRRAVFPAISRCALEFWKSDRSVNTCGCLPLIGAVTGTTRGTIRIMRGNLLDTFGQAFIEAARARGLKHRTVIWRHAVRMAITLYSIVILGTEAFPGILAGNLLVESVLGLPTIGPLYIQALISQDMFMAGTVLVLIVFLLPHWKPGN